MASAQERENQSKVAAIISDTASNAEREGQPAGFLSAWFISWTKSPPRDVHQLLMLDEAIFKTILAALWSLSMVKAWVFLIRLQFDVPANRGLHCSWTALLLSGLTRAYMNRKERRLVLTTQVPNCMTFLQLFSNHYWVAAEMGDNTDLETLFEGRREPRARDEEEIFDTRPINKMAEQIGMFLAKERHNALSGWFTLVDDSLYGEPEHTEVDLLYRKRIAFFEMSHVHPTRTDYKLEFFVLQQKHGAARNRLLAILVERELDVHPDLQLQSEATIAIPEDLKEAFRARMLQQFAERNKPRAETADGPQIPEDSSDTVRTEETNLDETPLESAPESHSAPSTLEPADETESASESPATESTTTPNIESDATTAPTETSAPVLQMFPPGLKPVVDPQSGEEAYRQGYEYGVQTSLQKQWQGDSESMQEMARLVTSYAVQSAREEEQPEVAQQREDSNSTAVVSSSMESTQPSPLPAESEEWRMAPKKKNKGKQMQKKQKPVQKRPPRESSPCTSSSISQQMEDSVSEETRDDAPATPQTDDSGVSSEEFESERPVPNEMTSMNSTQNSPLSASGGPSSSNGDAAGPSKQEQQPEKKRKQSRKQQNKHKHKQQELQKEPPKDVPQCPPRSSPTVAGGKNFKIVSSLPREAPVSNEIRSKSATSPGDSRVPSKQTLAPRLKQPVTPPFVESMCPKPSEVLHYSTTSTPLQYSEVLRRTPLSPPTSASAENVSSRQVGKPVSNEIRGNTPTTRQPGDAGTSPKVLAKELPVLTAVNTMNSTQKSSLTAPAQQLDGSSSSNEALARTTSQLDNSAIPSNQEQQPKKHDKQSRKWQNKQKSKQQEVQNLRTTDDFPPLPSQQREVPASNETRADSVTTMDDSGVSSEQEDYCQHQPARPTFVEHSTHSSSLASPTPRTGGSLENVFPREMDFRASHTRQEWQSTQISRPSTPATMGSFVPSDEAALLEDSDVSSEQGDVIPPAVVEQPFEHTWRVPIPPAPLAPEGVAGTTKLFRPTTTQEVAVPLVKPIVDSSGLWHFAKLPSEIATSTTSITSEVATTQTTEVAVVPPPRGFGYYGEQRMESNVPTLAVAVSAENGESHPNRPIHHWQPPVTETLPQQIPAPAHVQSALLHGAPLIKRTPLLSGQVSVTYDSGKMFPLWHPVLPHLIVDDSGQPVVSSALGQQSLSHPTYVPAYQQTMGPSISTMANTQPRPLPVQYPQPEQLPVHQPPQSGPLPGVITQQQLSHPQQINPAMQVAPRAAQCLPNQSHPNTMNGTTALSHTQTHPNAAYGTYAVCSTQAQSRAMNGAYAVNSTQAHPNALYGTAVSSTQAQSSVMNGAYAVNSTQAHPNAVYGTTVNSTQAHPNAVYGTAVSSTQSQSNTMYGANPVTSTQSHPNAMYATNPASSHGPSELRSHIGVAGYPMISGPGLESNFPPGFRFPQQATMQHQNEGYPMTKAARAQYPRQNNQGRRQHPSQAEFNSYQHTRRN